MLNTQDETPSKNNLVWRFAAAVLLLLTLLFLSLMIIGFANSGANQSELEDTKKQLSNKTEEARKLKQDLTNTERLLTEAMSKIDVMNKTVTDLTNLTNTLNQTVVTQQAKISSLQKYNLYWMIGGGSSLAFGAAAASYAVSEASTIRSLNSQIDTLNAHVKGLNNSLIESNKVIDSQTKQINSLKLDNTALSKALLDMTTNYWRFRNTFEASYRSTAEKYLLNRRKCTYSYNKLFDTNTDGWRSDLLKTAMTDNDNTAVFVNTTDNWVIGGFFTKKLPIDQSYSTDPDAFLLAVNRPSDAPIKSEFNNKAARVGVDGEMIQFGDGEVILRTDKTGTSTAGITYSPQDTSISVYEFYAGKSSFTVDNIVVYGVNVNCP